MGRIKPHKPRRIRPPRSQRYQSAASPYGNYPGPVMSKGRIMTAEVIAEMKAIDPAGLDDAAVAAILRSNARWINDPQLLAETEQLWQATEAAYPDSFGDCGCNDHDH